MDRRHFLKLAAGIAAAMPIAAGATQKSNPIDEGWVGFKPVDGPPYALNVAVGKGSHPLYCRTIDGNLFMLVNVVGDAWPGDILFWVDRNNIIVANSTYRLDQPKQVAGIMYGFINKSSAAWMILRGPYKEKYA